MRRWDRYGVTSSSTQCFFFTLSSSSKLVTSSPTSSLSPHPQQYLHEQLKNRQVARSSHTNGQRSTYQLKSSSMCVIIPIMPRAILSHGNANNDITAPIPMKRSQDSRMRKTNRSQHELNTKIQECMTKPNVNSEPSIVSKIVTKSNSSPAISTKLCP